jgi:hypothetical protein
VIAVTAEIEQPLDAPVELGAAGTVVSLGVAPLAGAVASLAGAVALLGGLEAGTDTPVAPCTTLVGSPSIPDDDGREDDEQALSTTGTAVNATINALRPRRRLPARSLLSVFLPLVMVFIQPLHQPLLPSAMGRPYQRSGAGNLPPSAVARRHANRA